MNRFKIGGMLAGFALISMSLVSCDDSTTDPVTTTPLPTVAKNLQATAYGDSAISIKFDKSASQDSAWFAGYEVSVSGETKFTPVSVSKADTVITFSGVNPGQIYTFVVKAKNKNNDVASAEIKWASALRFVENTNGKEILMYESNSSYGSGLALFNTADKSPKTLTVGSGADWDLGLNTKDGKMIIGSASKLGYSITPTATTEITTPVVAASLNAVFDSKSLDNKTYSATTIDLSQYSSNFVFFVKRTSGADVNYAKVLVKYVDNSFLQDSNPNKYVQLEVSYQATKGVPYAKIAE